LNYPRFLRNVDRRTGPLQVFVALIAYSVVVEYGIIMLLVLLKVPQGQQSFWAAFLLALFLCPVAFLLIYKPFSKDIVSLSSAEERLRYSEEKYQDLFEHANDAIFVVDSHFKYIDVNKKAVALFGYSKEEFLSMSIMDVIPAEQGEMSLDELKRLQRYGSYEKFTGKQRTKDGRWLDIEVSSSAIYDEAGEVVGSRDIVRDITRRKNIENRLMESHSILLTVLDSLDAIVYVTDLKTYEILFLNKFARNIFGDAVGRICWETFQEGQSGPCGFCTNDKLLDSEGRSTGTYVWEFQNTVNNHWYDIRDRAIQWIDGRLVRLEIATDITERKHMEQRLHEISITDDLTGLNNRRGFMTLAQQHLKLADRMRESVFLLYGDVDNLKHINDTLGHKTGDQALEKVAHVLRDTFRESDIMGRIGGDEFVVLLSDKTRKDNEKSILERLEMNFKAWAEKHNFDFELNMSCGIVRCPELLPCSIEELLTDADKLMYKQKQQKKIHLR